MQILKVMRIVFFMTFPLIAIAAVPPVHLGQAGSLTTWREIENGRMATETRLRRAVFDLIPATRDQRRLCREARKCGAARKSLDLGKHGGSFASYRKFIGRHSKVQRKSRRKLKKLFKDWLKEEREKVMKKEDKMH